MARILSGRDLSSKEWGDCAGEANRLAFAGPISPARSTIREAPADLSKPARRLLNARRRPSNCNDPYPTTSCVSLRVENGRIGHVRLRRLTEVKSRCFCCDRSVL